MLIRSIRIHPAATKRRTGVVSLRVIVEMTGDDGTRGFGEMSAFGRLPLYVPSPSDLERVLNLPLVGVPAEEFSALADLLRTAIAAVNRFEHHGATDCESPTHRFDVRGRSEARRNVDLPISEHVYDETHARALIDAGAFNIMNIYLTFAGGITPALTSVRPADDARFRTLIGTTQEPPIGAAAQVHFGCAVERLTDISDPTGPCLDSEDITAARVAYVASAVVLPEGPGFGIALDAELLERQENPLAIEGALPKNRNDLVAVLERT